MILPHGYRRLRLAERPAKTALINTKQRRLLSGHRGGVLKRVVHNKSGYYRELRLCNMAPCLWEMKKSSLRADDIQGLSADLLEAARRRNLSGNSLTAYERTWRRFLA